MQKCFAAAAALCLAAQLHAQTAPADKKPAAAARPAAAGPKAAAAPKKEAAQKPDTAAADKAAREAEIAKALDLLKAWDAKLETLKADFTQEIEFREAGLKQQVQGTLYYVKPNLLRIEHSRPARQVVVTDKKDIWIHKPDDSQAIRTSWDAWRATQDQNFSGILDFGGYGALAARNKTSLSTGKDGLRELTLTPRDGLGYVLTLRLGADGFPAGAVLTVDSAVITTRLTRAEKNATVDRELFKFTAPKGTEILQLKN